MSNDAVDGVMGVVNWFDSEKGYGFITADSGESAFIHHRNIQMDGYRVLNEGDRVSFFLMPSAKGWSAQNVTVQTEITTQILEKA